MGKRIDRVEQPEDHSLYNKLYGPIISDVSSGSNVATKKYLLAALKNQGRTVSEGVLSRLWQENVEGVAHTDIDRAINPGILEQLPQETQTDQKNFPRNLMIQMLRAKNNNSIIAVLE